MKDLEKKIEEIFKKHREVREPTEEELNLLRYGFIGLIQDYIDSAPKDRATSDSEKNTLNIFISFLMNIQNTVMTMESEKLYVYAKFAINATAAEKELSGLIAEIKNPPENETNKIQETNETKNDEKDFHNLKAPSDKRYLN